MGINMHKMEIVLLLFSLSVTSNIKIRCLKLWNIPKWIILWVVSFTTLSLSQALCKCSTHRVHLAVQQHRREEPPAPPFPVKVRVLGWHQFWVCSLFHRHSALLSCGQKLERLEMRATVEEMKTFVRLEVLPQSAIALFLRLSLCRTGLSLPSARIAGMYHYTWLPWPFP